ncbi:MAG: hypothetical protein ACYTHJ_16445 [Planctomycetota bacterium]|jgi:hypothetical protein
MQAVILLAMVVFGQAAAQENWSFEDLKRFRTDANLKDLGPFYVTVEDILSEDLPVTEDQIRTDVELRLRNHGIEVLEEQALEASCLYVKLIWLPIKNQHNVAVGYAYTVEVGFQSMAIFKNGVHSQAPIWSESSLGVTSKNQLLQDCRRYVFDYVDQFANAWLKVNPVKVKSNKP